MAVGETDHQAIFLGVAWSVYGLALLLSCARVYGRFVMTRQPVADDYLMLVTMFTSTAQMIASTLLASFMVGRHSWNITLEDRRKASESYYAAIASFILTIALTKIAILLQLAKIFRPFTKRALYWVCWGLIGFVIIWTVGSVLGDLLVCRLPDAKIWGKRNFVNKCSLRSWTVQGAISVTLDCIIMILPTRVIWKLHIPFKQKSLAIALLGVGSIGCFFSIVRTTSLHLIKPTNDAAYELFRIPLWFTLEALIAVCCGALMGSKQLILQWFPSLSPKPHEVLPPMQLDATPDNRKNSRNYISLDAEDINKLRLESLMYRLAVIGSPWAQLPKDTPSALEQGLNTKTAIEQQERPNRRPSYTPSRPKPVRQSRGRSRQDSINSTME
ncbi:hypothetical protein IAQ61_004245 [Plenodomus lingam]|uniref:Predicted protein n=1 Tax=Leptosphaeria maculans (strain JN3 / isolate v23.1.3 / race Av1-4-5-6-7-8) TaxID=985895 RepID=E4ZXK9_LEPMJ|nr:predicted protein [Plenodomus lingam JN3]KAH9873621.1 hypothetical protein IAQ61_004245 [Plenodomus lingam]CBX95419.1 predicted protein [Plenodomus lingam JN3]